MDIKCEIKSVAQDNAKGLKAIADIVIDDAVVIHSVGLMEKYGKRYISMPAVKKLRKDNKVIKSDIAHPISSSARTVITEEVFRVYDMIVNLTQGDEEDV